MRRSASAALLLLSTACQAYTTVPLSPSLQGKDVRVSLTPTGTGDLASTLGASASSVEGRFVSSSDSGVVVSMKSLMRTNGIEDNWNGEGVRIPAGDIASIETSHISAARSAIVTGVIVGGMYLISRSFLRGESTGSATTGGSSSGQ
jgi:hypothetical protein